MIPKAFDKTKSSMRPLQMMLKWYHRDKNHMTLPKLAKSSLDAATKHISVPS
jgi:hypothetical protein